MSIILMLVSCLLQALKIIENREPGGKCTLLWVLKHESKWKLTILKSTNAWENGRRIVNLVVHPKVLVTFQKKEKNQKYKYLLSNGIPCNKINCLIKNLFSFTCLLFMQLCVISRWMNEWMKDFESQASVAVSAELSSSVWCRQFACRTSDLQLSFSNCDLQLKDVLQWRHRAWRQMATLPLEDAALFSQHTPSPSVYL